jgi:hypothetical protein
VTESRSQFGEAKDRALVQGHADVALVTLKVLVGVINRNRIGTPDDCVAAVSAEPVLYADLFVAVQQCVSASSALVLTVRT